MPSVFAETISVCSQKDLAVWTLVSQKLPSYVLAKSYSVYVPDHEVELFKAKTNPRVTVYPESLVIGDFASKIKNHLDKNNQHRGGWYLQQFIKLAAVARHSPNDCVLIWDADTLPLKPLKFKVDEQFIFYIGHEYRPSYFEFTERVLGLKKSANHSFIAQCMPVHVTWVHDLIKLLEKKYRVDWMNAVLKNITSTEPAGFSEYETLGTFVNCHYPQSYAITKNAWCRNGISLVGVPQKLDAHLLKGLASQFDFISFENWDQPKRLMKKIGIQYRKLYYRFIGLLS
jgi:hypothetical protein